MWRHLPVSVAALLTVFTKAEVIVIAEPKARKLRHNKHVKGPFSLNIAFPLNPTFLKLYSVFAAEIIRAHYIAYVTSYKRQLCAARVWQKRVDNVGSTSPIYMSWLNKEIIVRYPLAFN